MAQPASTRGDEDLALAERCCAGVRSAHRELFAREVRRVHSTLYRILGGDPDIEDLVQDVFVEVFRSLHGFRGDATLSRWVDRVTVRVAFDHIARRKPRAARLSLVPEPADGAAAAEQRVLHREAARRLYGLLDRLSPKLRLAYALHVLDHRSLREVALAMGGSLAMAKARVWRASRWVEAQARKDPLLAGFVREGEES